MAESALLAHIVAQTRANVSFLAAQNHISQADATSMLSRLDAVQSKAITSPQAALANSMQSLSVSPPREAIPVVSPPPVRRDAPTPPSRLQKAQALWAYNEDGKEVKDLSFSSGEIVEIVEETNADWWTGKCRGKQGLFPSNHVEKIGSSTSSPAPALSPAHIAPAPSSYAPPAWSPPVSSMPSMPIPSQPPYGGSYGSEKSAPYPSYGGPPPPGPGYGAPPPPGPGYGAAPAPILVEGHKDKKKSKFGGDLGKTMASAAAGGVGFGAGAAIGGGIIDAIF